MMSKKSSNSVIEVEIIAKEEHGNIYNSTFKDFSYSTIIGFDSQNPNAEGCIGTVLEPSEFLGIVNERLWFRVHIPKPRSLYVLDNIAKEYYMTQALKGLPITSVDPPIFNSTKERDWYFLHRAIEILQDTTIDIPRIKVLIKDYEYNPLLNS